MSTSDDFFTCPRHAGGLRLTPDACAALWARGRAADALDPVARCQGCRIGAGHASAPLSASETRPPRVCVGCGAHCGGTTGRRLVVARGLCVSCYNRERELATGRYRRGRPPQRDPLPCRTLVVAGIAVVHPAGSLAALTLWALREARHLGPVARQSPDAERLQLLLCALNGRQILCGDPVQSAFWPGSYQSGPARRGTALVARQSPDAERAGPARG
jgi:hypothetical protein